MSQTKVEKQFIKNNRPFRNLLINGDMKIWQRYGGSAVTISDGSNEGYNSVDRWSMSFGSSAGGAIQWSRSTDVPAGEDFEYSLKMSPSTTTAATGTQELRFYQAIESQMIPDLAYGTSSAKTLTFSFYFKTNKVGLYSVYFQHAADGGTAKRKFLTFTPAASDTWERIVLKVTGDTATAQTMDDNSAGFYVYFTLDNTPNYDIDATEQDWTSSVLIGSENNVNFFDNTSNELYLTGCQLEVGDTPSDYEFLPFDIQLQRCMRYYEKSYNYSVAPGTSTTYEGTTLAEVIADGTTTRIKMLDSRFLVRKRAAPTLTIYTSDGGASGEINNYSSGADKTISSIGNTSETNLGRYMNMTDAGATNETYEFQYQADAEL
jgi:hypothetical protein